MKKAIALALTILILLTMASCGKKAEETISVATEPATVATIPETTEAAAPAETTEPTIPAPTEPEWVPGKLRAGYGEAVYRTFEAGTQLKVIGKFRSYYVVEQEDVDLLVTGEMLRMEGETFESWNGFSRSGAEVFDNPYLRGDPIDVLDLNTLVVVVESNGDWACVEWDSGKGYVKVEMISKWRITGGSGGGGGNNDGTDVSVDALASTNGDALPGLHLLGVYHGPEMEKDFQGGMATVLTDGTEGYICLLQKDDEVRVTEHGDDTATIWLGEDLFARIPRLFVKLEGDADYESWVGYARYGSIFYEEYQLHTQRKTLSINTQITILDEVNGRYVVEYEGKIGYLEKDMVSEVRITVNPGSSGGGGTWTPSIL